MDKTPLRMCRVCFSNRVGLFLWLMGRRACEKCMDQVIKDELEKFDQESADSIKELEDLKKM